MFRKLRIQAQIGVLLALMLAAFGAVGAVTWWSKNRNEVYDRAVIRTVRHIGISNQMQTDLSLGFGERNRFLEHPSTHLLKTHENFMGRIETSLRTAPADVVAMPEFVTARRGFDRYRAEFAEIADAQRVIGFDAKSGLHGDFDVAAGTLERLLETRARFPSLIIGMLRLRGQERLFVEGRDGTALEGHRARRQEFALLIAASSLPGSERRRLSAMLDDYAAKFESYAAAAATFDAKTAALRTHGSEAMEAMHGLVEATIAKTEQLNRQVARQKSDARGATAFLLLLVMGVTSLIALILGRDIAQPLQDMTKAMQDLAKGKLDTPIPALDYENEVGELAETFQIFKENAHMMRLAEDELARSEKLASLGSLVAGIAHELNTPIGNSLTVATALRDRAQDFAQTVESGQLKKSTLADFVSGAVEGTQIVEGNLERLSDLVAKFKQVAVDQTSDRRRPFDLKTMVDELMVVLRPMLKNQPHTLHVDIPEDIRMDSYPGPFGQVISNLCANAMIHAFDGIPTGRMDLTAVMGDGEVALTFSDDGKGISTENLGRVFDPFFTTRLGSGGSGLGLNIVYNIMTHTLGGRITVHSTPGIGTRFEMIVPLVAPSGTEDGML